MKKTVLSTLFLCSYFFLFAQKQNQFKVAAIGFYNFENLFDTFDDPLTNDEEFLPEGIRHWTKKIYEEKQRNLAKVVSELGAELSPDGVAILGVAEIENRLASKMHTLLKIRPSITWLKPGTLERSSKKTQLIEKSYE